MGGPLVKQLDVGGSYPALADPTAVELDGEAEAVTDNVDDLPRAGVVAMGQLGVMAVPVELGARLLDEDEVTSSGGSTRGPALDPGVMALPSLVSRLVSLLQDFFCHALLTGDRSLEPVAE